MMGRTEPSLRAISTLQAEVGLLVRSSSFDRARCIHWPAAVLAGDVVNVTTIPVA